MLGAFSKIRNVFRKNKLLVKIILSYIVIGALLLSGLSYILLRKFSDDSIDEINKISANMVYQSSRVTERFWDDTLVYLGSLYESGNYTEILNALYSRTFDPIEVRDIGIRLNDIVASNPLIHSVYAYNSQSDVVFSNLTTMKKVEDFFDKDIINRLTEANLPEGPVFIPRHVRFAVGANLQEHNFITVIYQVSKDGRPEEALIFNLKQEALQDMVTPKKMDPANQIFIIDSNGIVISHPDKSMMLDDLSEVDYVQRIMDSDKKEDRFLTWINEKKSLITFVKSDRSYEYGGNITNPTETYPEARNSFGWIFINVGNYNELLWKITNMQRTVFLLAGIFILISVLIAIFFTSGIYIPLYRLLKKARSGSGIKRSEKPMGEYEYLTDIYEGLVSDVENLQVSAKTNVDAARKMLLEQVINGEIVNIPDAINKIDELDMKLKSDYYMACILRFKSFKKLISEFSREVLAQYRVSICQISIELFNSGYEVECYDNGKDHISIIISMDSDHGDSLCNIKEKIAMIQSTIERNFDFSVTASIGYIAEGIRNIQFSYKSAMEASNYRIIYPGSEILDYTSIRWNKQEEYKYPVDTEKQLMDSLNLGDSVKLDRLMDKFIEGVSRFSYDEILLSLMQLALISVRTARGIITASDEKIIINYDIIYEQFRSFDELSQIREWYASLYKSILDAAKEKKGSKNSDIVEQIVKYIKENYSSENISVETLAEMVSLSPNYVRVLFKDSMNVSVTNYINDVRFKKAEELLDQTEYPANKIAEMVGFSNPKYFYLFFKKMSGKSPNDYRKEIRPKA